MPGQFSIKGAGKRKPMSEINVVPYIDVMLVLLVIFMITAPMLMQGVQVQLPQVTSDPVPTTEDKPPLVVTVDAAGAYYLEIGDDARLQLTIDQVEPQVRKILAQSPDIRVLVRGDRHVEYGKVVSLMATLQGAGAKSVGLITENPQE